MDDAVGEPVRTWLRERFGDRVRFAEPLSRHTSFRIGGPADVLVQPASPEELAAVVRAAAAARLPLTVLGAGSNLLVGDGGIRGVVVKLGAGFRGVVWSDGGAATISTVRPATSAATTRLMVAAVRTRYDMAPHRISKDA